jgi:glycosyltransferase involved in cell wall biosynthesis
VAWNSGAMHEIVDQGVTGYIVDTVDEAVAAVDKAVKLDRSLVRAAFEKRFSAMRMASDYVAIYARLLDRSSDGPKIGAVAAV